MGTLGHETETGLAVRSAPCMEEHPPAAGTMGVNKGQDGCAQSVLAQCTDDDGPLPRAIGGEIEMLEGAATACAEVRAGRRHTLGRRPAKGKKPASPTLH